MGILESLFGGGDSDPYALYGDLFTPQQKAALQQREQSQNLLKMAAAFGQAGMPSRLPVPFGAVLGQVAGSLAGDQDQAALKALQTAEAVRESQQKRALNAQISPILLRLLAQEKALGLPQGTLVKPAIASGAVPPGGGAPMPSSNAPPPPPIAPNTSDYGGSTGIPAAAPGGGDFPGATAGLLSGAPSNAALTGPGLLPRLASLYEGGGTGSSDPFGPAALGAAGGLLADLNRIKIEPLSGEAAPAGADVPFPTTANPNKPTSAWQQGVTYDAPSRPYDPSVDRPASAVVGPEERGLLARAKDSADPELARLSQLMKVETLPKPAAPNLTGSAWEVANNNFGGMRRPGVNASPSQGGFQTFDTPEAGVAAISRQLDRYASGATTGKPLSTIREIVSTWAPPNENDTEALIKRASRVMGVADNIPLNISDPAVKAKLIEATVRNEQGGKLPVDPALIERVASASPGSTVMPRMINVEPLGGEAVPADTDAPSSGTIPGLGISPQGLAALNALTKMGGLGSPFESLLETYYKSPGYLSEKARTEAQAQKDIALKMDPLIEEQTKRAAAKVELEYKPQIEEAVQKLQSPILKERAQAQADIDRVSEELKRNRDAALTPTDATIVGPGGVLTDEKISAWDLVQRQLARAKRIAGGDTTIQPGDVVGKPVGPAPAEHQYIMTPQGILSALPVPGTPAAQKAADDANKRLQSEQQNLIGRDVVVREVDNIGRLMDSATLPTTGFGGTLLQNLGGTAANDIRVARQTLDARLSRDALNAQRAASPTGAAMGNTSDADLAVLRTSLVNLDQSQTKEQFKERLQTLKNAYIDAVHGPGMSRLLPESGGLRASNATPSAGRTAAPPPPQVGEVRGGRRFQGGNPSDPNNWPRVE